VEDNHALWLLLMFLVGFEYIFTKGTYDPALHNPGAYKAAARQRPGGPEIIAHDVSTPRYSLPLRFTPLYLGGSDGCQPPLTKGVYTLYWAM
jgi:hypothetical protein